MTPGVHLDAGIYVRTGPAKDMVHKAPVGELELLDNHRSTILTAPDCTLHSGYLEHSLQHLENLFIRC